MVILSAKQREFAQNIGIWIGLVYERGYAVTFGEGWRTDEQAALYAANGKGISNSLHRLRLAQDFNLFRQNLAGAWVYETNSDSPEWKILGELWKGLNPLNRWGGDFKTRPDANHLSMEHEGIQ